MIPFLTIGILYFFYSSLLALLFIIFGTILVLFVSFLLWKLQKSNKKVFTSSSDKTINTQLSKDEHKESNFTDHARPGPSGPDFECNDNPQYISPDDYIQEFSKSQIDRKKSLIDPKLMKLPYNQVASNDEQQKVDITEKSRTQKRTKRVSVREQTIMSS